MYARTYISTRAVVLANNCVAISEAVPSRTHSIFARSYRVGCCGACVFTLVAFSTQLNLGILLKFHNHILS